MVVVVVFGLLGVGFFAFGVMVLTEAPAITQEIAGVLLLLTGIVAFGFGAVLSTLNELKNQREGE